MSREETTLLSIREPYPRPLIALSQRFRSCTGTSVLPKSLGSCTAVGARLTYRDLRSGGAWVGPAYSRRGQLFAIAGSALPSRKPPILITNAASRHGARNVGGQSTVPTTSLLPGHMYDRRKPRAPAVGISMLSIRAYFNILTSFWVTAPRPPV